MFFLYLCLVWAILSYVHYQPSEKGHLRDNYSGPINHYAHCFVQLFFGIYVLLCHTIFIANCSFLCCLAEYYVKPEYRAKLAIIRKYSVEYTIINVFYFILAQYTTDQSKHHSSHSHVHQIMSSRTHASSCRNFSSLAKLPNFYSLIPP